MSFLEDIQKRRTFGIISHPDAGKTTLTEKLLLFGGAIQEAGAVKSNKIKKGATSDFMEIERQRGISVATSVLAFNYRDKKITKKSYFKGYFKTGDIGYLNKNHLYFLGRLKNIIKVSGLIVYPEDIEKVLLKSKFIKECLVRGIYDDEQGESIIAYVIGNKDKEFEIFEHCLKYLENFQVPKKFIFKNSFPKTSLGKINTNLI